MLHVTCYMLHVTCYMSLFAVLGPLPLLVLGGGGALVVVVARAVPLAAGSLGSTLSTEINFFLKNKNPILTAQP